MLDELIEEFKDKIDIKDIYKYFNFEKIKEELLSNKSNIIFLLGSPGSGKSSMLAYLKYTYPDKYLLISNPFLTKEEFLKRYKNKVLNKTLLIDEAQLLSTEMIEFFRILSDKKIKIIYSMHIEEAKKIINLPQFKSRYIKIIYMKLLEFEEFEKYIMSKFIKYNYEHLINKRGLKKIYKYTKGNFRLSKKFIFTALNLLNYALKNKLKYKKIDSCIIEMTAIELGLIK